MRLQSPIRMSLIGLAFAWGCLVAAPSSAETLEELDALSDLSANEETGIEAAREHADRGEYLEALATLERVLAVHPKSHNARLIHAIYLCRIDDKQGGLVEIGKLKNKNYGDGVLSEARVMCQRGGV
jgi:hypothetical protein